MTRLCQNSFIMHMLFSINSREKVQKNGNEYENYLDSIAYKTGLRT